MPNGIPQVHIVGTEVGEKAMNLLGVFAAGKRDFRRIPMLRTTLLLSIHPFAVASLIPKRSVTRSTVNDTPMQPRIGNSALLENILEPFTPFLATPPLIPTITLLLIELLSQILPIPRLAFNRCVDKLFTE